MKLDLQTPAFLFPAISLLLLAYTNRFLHLAALIRSLHGQHKQRPDPLIVAQIGNLRYRLQLIRRMQSLGVASLFGCVFCMFVLFTGHETIGKYVFGTSLVLMMGSLSCSLLEIRLSVVALNLHLGDLEQDQATHS
ncbi:DUF2721 domain-containing protein [bacterium]|nr:MAG: DUF2721 domain-containing protein [bacterium]